MSVRDTGITTPDASVLANPLPDAGSPPDAAGHAPDAAGHTPDAAGHAPDAAGAFCDVDGDGFLRDAPECPRGGLPADCHDEDPSQAPGVVECRNGRDDGCGVHQDLGMAIGIPEIGRTVTQVIAVNPYTAAGLTSVVVPRAWGRFTRGVTARLGQSLATLTILPSDFTLAPDEFVLDDMGDALVELGHRPGSSSPLLAIARRSGEVSLLDIRDGLPRELVSDNFSGVIALGIAGREKTALVVAESTAAATRLNIRDEDGNRVFMLPAVNTSSWIAARGDLAVFGAYARTVHVVSLTSEMSHTIQLDADIAGEGALVSTSNGFLAMVPTTAGLRAIRFPRCDTNAECAGGGVVTHATDQTIINGAHLSMTNIEGSGDLVAIALAASDQVEPATHVDVIFVNGNAPQTELGRTVAFGAGSLDGRTITRALAVSVDNSADIYGGAFLMVSAMVQTGSTMEEWSTGFTMCLTL